MKEIREVWDERDTLNEKYLEEEPVSKRQARGRVEETWGWQRQRPESESEMCCETER